MCFQRFCARSSLLQGRADVHIIVRALCSAGFVSSRRVGSDKRFLRFHAMVAKLVDEFPWNKSKTANSQLNHYEHMHWLSYMMRPEGEGQGGIPIIKVIVQIKASVLKTRRGSRGPGGRAGRAGCRGRRMDGSLPSSVHRKRVPSSHA